MTQAELFFLLKVTVAHSDSVFLHFLNQTDQNSWCDDAGLRFCWRLAAGPSQCDRISLSASEDFKSFCGRFGIVLRHFVASYGGLCPFGNDLIE